MLDVPEIVAEEIVVETEPEEISHNAKAGNDLLVRSIAEKISNGPMYGLAASEHVPSQISDGVDAAGALTKLISVNGIDLQNGEIPLLSFMDIFRHFLCVHVRVNLWMGAVYH